MTIEWTEKNGDTLDVAGIYAIEQTGANSFWAFMGNKPIGTYSTAEKAKARCEIVKDQADEQQ